MNRTTSVILHAGMPKTGTSAIQRALAHHRAEGFHNIGPGEGPLIGNASMIYSLMFEDYAAFGARFPFSDLDAEGFLARRQHWQRTLCRTMASGEITTIVLSAERIYNSSPAAIERMAAWLAPHARDISVIAYLRSPRSYMASALQQQIQAGLARFEIPPPLYRERLAPLERFFGAASMTLVKYDPALFAEGDVVQDFAERTGLALQRVAEGPVNTGLSHEATALLYADRRLAPMHKAGYAMPRPGDAALLQALRQIEGARFALGSDLGDRLCRQYQGEIAWAEARLGLSLDEAPSGEIAGIESEDDLFETAIAARTLLEPFTTYTRPSGAAAEAELNALLQAVRAKPGQDS